MGRIAVDVVLLPDENMTAVAIESNKELVEKFGFGIALNKENCLPHISLAMGVIDEKQTDNIKNILEKIARESPPGPMNVIGIAVTVNFRGEEVSSFLIEKTGELQMLHRKIMEGLSPYLGSDATADMTADKKVEESTLAWIKNYRAKSSFENFWPHITIGYGRTGKTGFPIKFSASKLAMCHLGNHCTCRKILASVQLGKIGD
jgi:2'-5' RNA ligase